MKLGDMVFVSATLEKRQELFNSSIGYETTFCSVPCPIFIGMYIGYRTDQTGTTHMSEDGLIFRAKGKVKYLLVVKNERTNPIKADPNFTHLLWQH